MPDPGDTKAGDTGQGAGNSKVTNSNTGAGPSRGTSAGSATTGNYSSSSGPGTKAGPTSNPGNYGGSNNPSGSSNNGSPSSNTKMGNSTQAGGLGGPKASPSSPAGAGPSRGSTPPTTRASTAGTLAATGARGPLGNDGTPTNSSQMKAASGLGNALTIGSNPQAAVARHNTVYAPPPSPQAYGPQQPYGPQAPNTFRDPNSARDARIKAVSRGPGPLNSPYQENIARATAYGESPNADPALNSALRTAALNNEQMFSMPSGTDAQQKLVKDLGSTPLHVAINTGLDPRTVLGQAMTESTTTKNPTKVSTLASDANNVFGFKVGKGRTNEYWDGQSTTMNTNEYTPEGKLYTEDAGFRKYDSVNQSMLDYGRRMGDPQFDVSREGTFADQATNLAKAGYATHNAEAYGNLVSTNANRLSVGGGASDGSPTGPVKVAQPNTNTVQPVPQAQGSVYDSLPPQQQTTANLPSRPTVSGPPVRGTLAGIVDKKPVAPVTNPSRGNTVPTVDPQMRVAGAAPMPGAIPSANTVANPVLRTNPVDGTRYWDYSGVEIEKPVGQPYGSFTGDLSAPKTKVAKSQDRIMPEGVIGELAPNSNIYSDPRAVRTQMAKKDPTPKDPNSGLADNGVKFAEVMRSDPVPKNPNDGLVTQPFRNGVKDTIGKPVGQPYGDFKAPNDLVAGGFPLRDPAMGVYGPSQPSTDLYGNDPDNIQQPNSGGNEYAEAEDTAPSQQGIPKTKKGELLKQGINAGVSVSNPIAAAVNKIAGLFGKSAGDLVANDYNRIANMSPEELAQYNITVAERNALMAKRNAERGSKQAQIPMLPMDGNKTYSTGSSGGGGRPSSSSSTPTVSAEPTSPGLAKLRAAQLAKPLTGSFA